MDVRNSQQPPAKHPSSCVCTGTVSTACAYRQIVIVSAVAAGVLFISGGVGDKANLVDREDPEEQTPWTVRLVLHFQGCRECQNTGLG